MEILKNFANLVKVKTIVTLVVVAVFAYMALTGAIEADNVMLIVSMVISFYFGTQHEKN
jgi:hypothetical protein